MSRYSAWIVSIGNELLIGRTLNTNATWLCRKLTLLGYDVRRVITVPDDESEVVDVIREALRRRIRLVITTGGLGPTFDDKTSLFLAKALGREYVMNEDAYRMIERTCRERGIKMTEHIVKQAMMPKNAKAIPNVIGSAPGIWIEEGETLIISLPGVPQEMMIMFEHHVEPKLREIGPRMHFAEKTLRVYNIMESTIAPAIERCMKMCKVYIKSHPRGPMEVEIHVYSSDVVRENAEREVERACSLLEQEIKRMGGIMTLPS